jgi:hypothetical protein
MDVVCSNVTAHNRRADAPVNVRMICYVRARTKSRKRGAVWVWDGAMVYAWCTYSERTRTCMYFHARATYLSSATHTHCDRVKQCVLQKHCNSMLLQSGGTVCFLWVMRDVWCRKRTGLQQ